MENKRVKHRFILMAAVAVLAGFITLFNKKPQPQQTTQATVSQAQLASRPTSEQSIDRQWAMQRPSRTKS